MESDTCAKSENWLFQLPVERCDKLKTMDQFSKGAKIVHDSVNIDLSVLVYSPLQIKSLVENMFSNIVLYKSWTKNATPRIKHCMKFVCDSFNIFGVPD